jgi:hypothetical protein
MIIQGWSRSLFQVAQQAVLGIEDPVGQSFVASELPDFLVPAAIEAADPNQVRTRPV